MNYLSQESDARPQKYRILLFVLGITYMTYGTFVDLLFTMRIGRNQIDSIICLSVLLIVGVLYIVNNRVKLHTSTVVIAFIMFVFFYIDSMFPMYVASKHKAILNSFLTKACYGYFFTRILTDKGEIKKGLRYIAYITFFSCVFMPFMPAKILAMYDTAGDYGAYMLFGYKMVLAPVIFLYLFFQDKKRIDLFFAIISIVEVVLFGNRGAAIVVAAYLLVHIVFFSTGKKRILMIVFVCVVSAIYTWLSSEDMLRTIISFLNSRGLASRNLTLLLDSTIKESGRDYIYDKAIRMIKANGFRGIGISASWTMGLGNSYPHNLFYEIWLQFGTFFGTIFILSFMLPSVSIICGRRPSAFREIYAIFFIAAVVELLFSSSYLVNWWFWVMIGMMLNCLEQIKKERVQVQNT